MPPSESTDPQSKKKTSQKAEKKPTGTAPVSATQGKDKSDLPEREPLTPELVEEEAIRGDFVLRWAVILLAVLYGCTMIYESTTLVHVKTGQYLAENGFWPPSVDPFSYTASERRWVNLSWLFDLIIAGKYAVVGWAGLSIFKAVIAGLTFWLVIYTSRKNIPTWWGSVCAALAVLVCAPRMTAEPELLTLLGLAATLFVIYHWRENEDSRILWVLPGIFLLWANMDPRMFLGLGLLVLYGLGNLLGSVLGRSRLPNVSQYWIVTAGCFVAAILNPFGWHSLMAPFAIYGVEYPLMRSYIPGMPGVEELQYYSLLSTQYWETLSYHLIAGLFVLISATVLLGLNWKSLDLGDAFVLAGFVCMPMLAGHELGAATLVACVLGTVNAQQWYENTFRQTYSIETRELIFTRGGRAITVIALFLLSWLCISGRLNGPDGRRTGIGLENSLAVRAQAMTEELADSYDNRPFNMTLEQGDILIWADQKVFIDSRLALYAGEEDEDLVKKHQNTRQALRLADTLPEANARRILWKRTFDQYNITHVLPRVTGPNPDHATYFDLIRNGNDWQLAHLRTLAVFYRLDLNDPELKKYLSNHTINFQERAWKTEVSVETNRGVFAQAPTFYQKWLHKPMTITPRPLLEARNYNALLDFSAVQRIDASEGVLAALCYLTIQKANEGLAENPQSADGYRLLGSAYLNLMQLEQQSALRRGGTPSSSEFRYRQVIMAMNQAVTADPDSYVTRFQLGRLYQDYGKWDLALRELEAVRELLNEEDAESEAEEQQRTLLDNQIQYLKSFKHTALMQVFVQNKQQDLAIREMEALRDLITENILTLENLDTEDQQTVQQNIEFLKQRRDQLEQELSQVRSGMQPEPLNRLKLAMDLKKAGCIQEALLYLDDDVQDIDPNQQIPLEIVRSECLLEAGRLQDALDVCLQLEGISEQYGALGNTKSTTAVLYIGMGNYEQAIQLLESEIQSFQRSLVGQLASAPVLGGWPGLAQMRYHEGVEMSPLFGRAIENQYYQIGMCYLEMGQPGKAAERFQMLLDHYPGTSHRPILLFYLHYLTGKSYEFSDLVHPGSLMPTQLENLFAPEPPSERQPLEAPRPELPTPDQQPAEAPRPE